MRDLNIHLLCFQKCQKWLIGGLWGANVDLKTLLGERALVSMIIEPSIRINEKRFLERATDNLLLTSISYDIHTRSATTKTAKKWTTMKVK